MNDRIDDTPSGEDSALCALAPPLLMGESTPSVADDAYRLTLPPEPGWTGAPASVQLEGETRVDDSSDIVVHLTPAGRRYRAILDTDGRAVYLIESWRNAQSETESRQALELSEREARALATGDEAALQATLAKPAFLARLSHELSTP